MVEQINTASDERVMENRILQYLSEHNQIDDTLQFAQRVGVTHTDLDKSLKSLLVDDYLELGVIERKLLELTDEGATYADKGTPEYQYASALELNVPTDKSAVEGKVGAEIAKIGFAKAMQRKWIKLDGDNKNGVVRIAEKLEDQEKDLLTKYRENPDLEAHDKKVVE